jgi:hypothetical protein
VLPHGLYYGGLDPASAVAVTGSHLSGHVDLDHLRGRSGLAMPVQAAEVALRRRLVETREDAVRFRRREVDGTTTRAWFEAGAATYAVEVRSGHDDEPHRLTCGVDRLSRIPRHDVVDVRRA